MSSCVRAARSDKWQGVPRSTLQRGPPVRAAQQVEGLLGCEAVEQCADCLARTADKRSGVRLHVCVIPHGHPDQLGPVDHARGRERGARGCPRLRRAQHRALCDICALPAPRSRGVNQIKGFAQRVHRRRAEHLIIEKASRLNGELPQARAHPLKQRLLTQRKQDGAKGAAHKKAAPAKGHEPTSRHPRRRKQGSDEGRQVRAERLNGRQDDVGVHVRVRTRPVDEGDQLRVGQPSLGKRRERLAAGRCPRAELSPGNEVSLHRGQHARRPRVRNHTAQDRHHAKRAKRGVRLRDEADARSQRDLEGLRWEVRKGFGIRLHGEGQAPLRARPRRQRPQ